ncbi:uncharacterized protein LOC124413685 [Diprion similis]|uniref:uncharacterized protein LOC124413685 n=1 Tax=Diprion similis TaxID=362088 RepID=UPI001EF7F4BC|nr:uncharacterized protein LOC124413685 [Diprion similis]XP_046750371.1 uncharacterized protein LOC124413685 [Diprion similis]XP_046750372.1 uncharacterized protein LOC124413685 [Diprion similis]
MNTPNRDFLRRPDGVRRRSARQALAVIPDMAGLAVSPGEVITLDANAIDNLANSRPGFDSWSPAPSPDELVIQKRGRRRKTIVWSPDVEARKRDSLFSLSSRDRTPVKSPTKSNIMLRSTPRKRLMLGDSNEQQLSTPEKQIKVPAESCNVASTILECEIRSRRHVTTLVNDLLKGLSNEQLVKIIMNLISMQEGGSLSSDGPLREVILKQIPMVDIKPLEERLKSLRTNIHASLSSDTDAMNYSDVTVHLDAYQATLVNQGKLLVESQHWISVMEYIFSAWAISKEIPNWEHNGLKNVSRSCFKALACFCAAALQRGKFQPQRLEIYMNQLERMSADCEDLRLCLQVAKDKVLSNAEK